MTYADEILDRRRQAKADDAFPWHATFEELSTGIPFRTSARRVTEADVTAFAALTGDRHPQHLDPGFATVSPAGERVAHALLVLSLSTGLVPWDPRRVMALHRVADALFERPVVFGDELHVEGTLAGLAPASEDAGLVSFDWSVVKQDGAVACRARVEVLWHRDEHFVAGGR